LYASKKGAEMLNFSTENVNVAYVIDKRVCKKGTENTNVCKRSMNQKPACENITDKDEIDRVKHLCKAEFPVKIRITHNRKQYYIGKSLFMSVEDWEKIENPKTKAKETTELRKRFEKELDVLKETIESTFEKTDFDIEKLLTAIGKGDKTNIFNEFDATIRQLYKEDRISTASSYTCTFASLWKYVNNYKGDVPFSQMYESGDWKNGKGLYVKDINVDFVKKYKQHLQSKGSGKEKGKSIATIGIYLRTFRAILNKMKVPPKNYPFGKGTEKVKIAKGSARKIALSKSLIASIENYPLTGNKKLYRDLFIFSYRCNGAYLSDIFNLRHENIKNGCLEFVRTKTDETSGDPVLISAYLTEPMKRIIADYGTEPLDKREYLFPFLKRAKNAIDEKRIVDDYNKRLSKMLKKLSKELGIEANVTAKVARHSFAVNSERNGQRLSLTSKAMGHTSIETTANYLGSFTDSEIIDNANNL
jgi:integrase